LIVIDVDTSPSGMPVERCAHVLDRVDRDARSPNLAETAWVIRIESQLGRQVERHRQAGRAVVEEIAVALVGLPG
jgi:hypothetical protein